MTELVNYLRTVLYCTGQFMLETVASVSCTILLYLEVRIIRHNYWRAVERKYSCTAVLESCTAVLKYYQVRVRSLM
jgi:hypothetical protein